MALKQPNTLCKNVNCTKGVDGGRKHYYACAWCAHSENWRSVACSWDCYLEFQQQLIEARNHNKPVDTLPERTDMTPVEVEQLIAADDDVVRAATEIELADEIEENPSYGFDMIVDQINEELDYQCAVKAKRKKK